MMGVSKLVFMIAACAEGNNLWKHWYQLRERLCAVLCCLLMSFLLCSCECRRASPILYWGCVPNEEEMKVLKAMGIKTIINLRTNSHKGRTELAQNLGLNFYHIKTGVALTPELPEIRKFLTIISDPANRPTFVCCNIGIDRTAYYVAVYRMAFEGWTVQQAEDEMLAHELKQWWYTFTKYKNSLRANEAAIRRIARELDCPYFPQENSKGVCPCVQLGSMKRLHENPICLDEIRLHSSDIINRASLTEQQKKTAMDLQRSDYCQLIAVPDPPNMKRIGPLDNRIYAIRLKIDQGVNNGKLTQSEARDFDDELARIRGLEDKYSTDDGYVSTEQKSELWKLTEILDKSVNDVCKSRKIITRTDKTAKSSVKESKKTPFSWSPSQYGGFYDATGQINGRIPLTELQRFGGHMSDGTAM